MPTNGFRSHHALGTLAEIGIPSPGISETGVSMKMNPQGFKNTGIQPTH
jgi:hypothetical protein